MLVGWEGSCWLPGDELQRSRNRRGAGRRAQGRPAAGSARWQMAGSGWGRGAAPGAGPVAACPPTALGGLGGAPSRGHALLCAASARPGGKTAGGGGEEDACAGQAGAGSATVPRAPLPPRDSPAPCPACGAILGAASALPSPLHTEQGCAKTKPDKRGGRGGIRNKAGGRDVAPAARRDGRPVQQSGAASSCHGRVCCAGWRRQGFGNRSVVSSVRAPRDARLLLTGCLLLSAGFWRR